MWRERAQSGMRGQQMRSWNGDTTRGIVTDLYNQGTATPIVGLMAPIGAVNAGQVFTPFMAQHTKWA